LKTWWCCSCCLTLVLVISSAIDLGMRGDGKEGEMYEV
jgi:hypothetical protein